MNYGTSKLIVGCTDSLIFEWKMNSEFEYIIKVGEQQLKISLPNIETSKYEIDGKTYDKSIECVNSIYSLIDAKRDSVPDFSAIAILD